MKKNTDVHKLISIFKVDCTTKLKNDIERKFHNGHEYVDLGLPSGTLWATCNVGAESETEYGNYYKYGGGSETYTDTLTSYQGMETQLDPSADTATQVLGGLWHMPTKEQVRELIANTTYEWVVNYKGSGIKGGLFTAQNGNSVFFPACGCKFNGQYLGGGCCHYWTSSISESQGYELQLNAEPYSYELQLNMRHCSLYTNRRYIGFPVRGVFSRN